MFVDADGRAMTDAVYYKRFSILKERFIERLRNSDNFDAKSYAVYLSTYKWSTHLCRGYSAISLRRGQIISWRSRRGEVIKTYHQRSVILRIGGRWTRIALRILDELYKGEIG